ncbi:MAG TPA: flippase [Terriglobales bacterium]|nr:flippase [Terriglobales bacterium]
MNNLTSGSLLARNTVWNLIGQGSPLVVAAVAIPILVRHIGVDRYGVLSISWMLIGYFSLFDFGVGRALTKFVADRLGTNTEHELPSLIWTSLALMLLLGIIGGICMAALSPWLVARVLRIPPYLHYETLHTFYLLSFGTPFVITTTGFRGILEAQQRFGIVNAIRIPMGAFTFAGPLLVIPFSNHLVPIVALLLIGRVLLCVVYGLACLHSMPSLLTGFALRAAIIRPVLSFGSWVTVSNVVSPLMQSMDRFLIGALLSVSAVAYYSAPFDVISRISILPAAVAGVLFPAFAMTYAQDHNHLLKLLARSLKFIFLVVFPVVLLIVTFAPEGLRLWLGPAFADQSASVTRWLAAGTLVNCLALVPTTFIQGIGRPDITAKLHLIELPLYLAGAWWLIRARGIEGAAVAWVVRVILDGLLLFIVAETFLERKGLNQLMGTFVFIAMCILAVASLIVTPLTKLTFLFVVFFVFVISAWFLFLNSEDRAIVNTLRRRTVGSE